MQNQSSSLCPCCSGQLYQECCQKFHQGNAIPDTAQKLMRSRYAAYALGLANYIIMTTHPDHPDAKRNREQWLKEILQFSKQTQFIKLEILKDEEGEKESFVTFVAHLKQSVRDATFTERSYFQKIDNRWYYLSGKVIPGRVLGLA